MVPQVDHLRELAGAFVVAPQAQLSDRWKQLAAALKAAISKGAIDDAAVALRAALQRAELDYTTARHALRLMHPLKGNTSFRSSKIRFAILGSFTTHQLLEFIDLFLFASGVEAEVYEADYGVSTQEIIDLESGLHEFRPEIVFLATTWRDGGYSLPSNAGVAEADAAVEEAARGWLSLWTKANADMGCQIIQDIFALPACRPFVNHEMRQPGSLGRFLSSLNRALVETAPPYVVLHDVDQLAATVGRWRWDDPRFYHQAKLPCDPECLVDYARSVSSIVAAQLGLAKKCLVLDLDNTLWGGVIGDDGIGGIKLGQGDPEGEAYLEFQRYVRSLRQRGVLLAVCSKNNHDTAMSVFRDHTEMALRPEDVACFMINWSDKAANIRAIAKELNIGVDSLVFVDDNPAERAIVRQLVPEVAVPELPADVTGYIRAIEQHRYFQTLSVGAEDLKRTEFYQADAARKAAQSSVADMESFLRSLQMTARIEPINSANLERSAQLIQRSNQFNLTTRRRSVAELTRLMENPDWITVTISLSDRFGDNGLISVILACQVGKALEIDTWLMSCRVLKRGVEQAALNHLLELARLRGLESLRGEYIPTSKNALVRDHYAGLGFSQIGEGDGGTTRWELPLGAASMTNTFIQQIN